MKKAAALIAAIYTLLSFTACSRNDIQSTYFIHVLSFSQSKDKTEIHALCEKTGSKDDDYFVISQKGKDFDDAAEKLSDKYKNCYFATCRIYLFEKDADSDFLKKAASQICSSNVYPTRCNVMFINKNSSLDFLKSIKDSEDLFNIMQKNGKKNKSLVRFFSEIMSGKESDAPTAEKNSTKKKESS